MVRGEKGERIKHTIWLIAGAVVVGAALVGPIMSDVEQAKYTVVLAQDDNEIRDYVTAIVAEATVSGTRKKAIQQGFYTIVDYIFGNNNVGEKVAKTVASLSKLTNAQVTLKQVPEKHSAAECFSGTASEENLDKHTELLIAVIVAQKLHALSAPTYVFYKEKQILQGIADCIA